MSLENAILELAAAMRDQAVAVNAQVAASRELLASYNSRHPAGSPANPAREAIQEALDKAKEASTEKKAKKVADAELEQAVQKVEADAGKSDAGAAGQTQHADTAGSAKESAGTEQAALDYEKDVKPVLVKLFQAKGKPVMNQLVKSFGVEKATELKGDQLVQIVAKANALMAA